MKIIAFSFLLLLSGYCTAQNQYIVLHKGDTIRGKRIVVARKRTYIRTAEGKLRFPNNEVAVVQGRRHKFVVAENPFVNRYYPYRVTVDGKVKMLEDRANDLFIVKVLNFVVIEDKMYPIDRVYLSNEIWDILAGCKAFEEKYRDRRQRNPFILNVTRQRKFWREMIAFYNAECGE
jgi:hypothetical protein